MVEQNKTIFIIIQFISFSRAIAAFVFTTTSLANNTYFTFILFLYACLTDLLDGFLARKFRYRSEGGRILDMFGDKYLTINSVIYAIFQGIEIIPCSLIIFREVFLLTFRNIPKVMPPEKKIGAPIAILTWIVTLILILTKIRSTTNIFYFNYIYWLIGILAFIYTIYKIKKSWKLILKAFEVL